ncbi:hypothetical protein V1504DRAFT_442742 [Lipomyces starkeyi]
MAIASMADAKFDVIIIGAGISGINTAYRLQEGLRDYSYAVLDARSEFGGTWSLFKYPGIRSDADLHTFGLSWERHGKETAHMPMHQLYLSTTSTPFFLESLRLSLNNCCFVVLDTGYYDHTQGLNSKIPGLESFKGTVVHPQFWPENLDYSKQKVVIIGSGARAATMVPAMNEQACQVTMLQRSPSYFMTIPLANPLLGIELIRIRYILLAYFLVYFCWIFPTKSKELLRRQTERQLPKNVPHDTHFVPSYLPWQQRICFIPQVRGDFFDALRTGKANIVTDHIETIKDNGIKLKSGQELEADIIVTATGLNMLFPGGTKFFVDGEEHHIKDKHTWHGALLQDLPNLTFIFGYTNAHSRSVKEVPWLNLNSSYIKSALEHQVLPKGGDIGPWKPKSKYF